MSAEPPACYSLPHPALPVRFMGQPSSHDQQLKMHAARTCRVGTTSSSRELRKSANWTGPMVRSCTRTKIWVSLQSEHVKRWSSWSSWSDKAVESPPMQMGVERGREAGTCLGRLGDWGLARWMLACLQRLGRVCARGPHAACQNALQTLRRNAQQASYCRLTAYL